MLGHIIGKKLLPVVVSGMFAEEYTNAPIIYSTNPVIFVVSTFMTLLTIFISVYRPAKAAARYNAIEAAKFYLPFSEFQRLSWLMSRPEALTARRNWMLWNY